jgi:hypothetical protein
VLGDVPAPKERVRRGLSTHPRTISLTLCLCLSLSLSVTLCHSVSLSVSLSLSLPPTDAAARGAARGAAGWAGSARDAKLPARLDENALDRGVVREVGPRKKVVHLHGKTKMWARAQHAFASGLYGVEARGASGLCGAGVCCTVW